MREQEKNKEITVDKIIDLVTDAVLSDVHSFIEDILRCSKFWLDSKEKGVEIIRINLREYVNKIFRDITRRELRRLIFRSRFTPIDIEGEIRRIVELIKRREEYVKTLENAKNIITLALGSYHYAIFSKRKVPDGDLIKEEFSINDKTFADTMDWKKINGSNIDKVPFVKEVEFKAKTEGIISSLPPYGYKFSKFYLEFLLPLVDPEIRSIILKILENKPELNGPYYIINPRREYRKAVARYKFKKVVIDEKKKEFIKVLHKYVPLSKSFEKKGKIIIKASIRFKDGSEKKLELLTIDFHINDKHPNVTIPELKLYKDVVKKKLGEIKDPRYKKKIMDWLSKLGNRESLLVYIHVNGKKIYSPHYIDAAYAKKLHGDKKVWRSKYVQLYKSSLILPLEKKMKKDEERKEWINLTELFGNQKIYIVPKGFVESLWKTRNRKELKKKIGLVFYRNGSKDVEYDEEGNFWWYVLSWYGRGLNHVIVSDEPFDVKVFGFREYVKVKNEGDVKVEYNKYYVIPTRDGQEFTILNLHHGKEKKYSLRCRLKVNEVIEITHFDPDLQERNPGIVVRVAKSI